MAKRTAIIDIGSNSARMVVFERTSRYGFHLLNEIKSRVRISEGAYAKDGILQKAAMERAYMALEQFMEIARAYKCRKLLCVATSALRDAPNKNIFLHRIYKNLGIKIKIIDGEKEAELGGIAAANLLPISNGITIDIGGGSTDISYIQNKKVLYTHSLNLGTVRLKELFFDNKSPIEDAKRYIDQAIKTLPSEFKNETAIGIGGTARAISKAIMIRNDHPIEKIHAFRYGLSQERKFITKLSNASVLKLSKYGIKKNRIDTIRPGALIFDKVLKYIGAKEVVTSGVGVREGLFLSDLLRSSHNLFPANFNPSIKSIEDRFCMDSGYASSVAATAKVLFDTLKEPFGLPFAYEKQLLTAAKLSQIGVYLDFYDYHRHSAYFLMNNLDYGFTHEDMILIATLVRFNKKRLPKEGFVKPYKKLLPKSEILSWLSYIVSLSQILHTNRQTGRVDASYINNVLSIAAPFNIYLAKEAIKTVEKPAAIAVHLYKKPDRRI